MVVPNLASNGNEELLTILAPAATPAIYIPPSLNLSI
jgi:hypothetical protein